MERKESWFEGAAGGDKKRKASLAGGNWPELEWAWAHKVPTVSYVGEFTF